MSFEQIGNWKKFCCLVIKTGSLPQHVGFIMDGNRRFAQKFLQKSTFGHWKGFEKLKEIRHISVFAFSLENFNRTNEELNDLYEILKSKINEFLLNVDFLKNSGIRIKVIGDLTFFGPSLQRMCQNLCELTSGNTLYRSRFLL
ncbi:hypothetical protein MXB_3782 [Myxobolus squamalis]|nr:hypothetical protein MXB_3782 [Myxobolus squamalis]